MINFDRPPVPPVMHSGTWGGIRNHRFHLGDDDLRVLVHEDGRVGIYAPGRRITVDWLAGDTITLRLTERTASTPAEEADVTGPGDMPPSQEDL